MPDDQEGELPPHLRRLWGLDGPGQRGPRPALTVRAVVDAAVDLADAEGLEAVSMARVAEQLGCATMALYRHVSSKDELLQLMFDAAAGAPPPPPTGADWRAATRAWVEALFAVYRRHPWAIQVPVVGPPAGPNHVAWAEAGLAALRDSGLDTLERIAIVTTLTLLVRADVSLMRELAGHQAGRPWAEVERAYGQFLRRVLDPARFPEMTQVLDAAVGSEHASEAGDDLDTGSTFGLEVLLDGVEAFVARRRDGGAAGRGRVSRSGVSPGSNASDEPSRA